MLQAEVPQVFPLQCLPLCLPRQSSVRVHLEIRSSLYFCKLECETLTPYNDSRSPLPLSHLSSEPHINYTAAIGHSRFPAREQDFWIVALCNRLVYTPTEEPGFFKQVSL